MDTRTQTTVKLRPFPQIAARNQIPTTILKSIFGKAINNEGCFRWFNREFSQALSKLTPQLSSIEKRIVEDLRANGLAFAHFDELFAPGFYAEIKSAFGHYLENFQATQKKTDQGKAIFLDTIHKAHNFVANDPVSSYLAAPQFAAISAHYMQMVPRFVGSSFWHTRPAKADGRLFSQQWHRDYNDRRLVKIFLYLNDVGQENGYFEHVTGTQVGGPLGDRFDTIGEDGLRAYPDQEALGRVLEEMPVIDLDGVPLENRTGSRAPWHGKPSVVRGQAPEGSLIFADTFGIHRGGYIKNGHRDMIMLTYSTNYNVHKPHFSVTSDFAATLSPFMRKSFGVE